MKLPDIGVLTERRSSVIACGLFLVFVPTLWGLFPEFTEWAWPWRVGALVLWLASAYLVVEGAVVQSEQIDVLIGRPLERQEQQRQVAAERVLIALLPPKDPPLSGYHYRVFLPNEDTGRLTSSFSSASSRQIEWDYGRGATGRAWEEESLVVARGPACSDGTHGLTPEEQARYQQLQIVAAMPVRNARREVVAILTASSETDDGSVDREDFNGAFVELSDVVARVLIDVLGAAKD